MRVTSQVMGDATFPHGSRGVCYYVIKSNQLVEVGYDDAVRRARRGGRVYATWHGQWRTDMFEVDDLYLGKVTP